MFFKEYFTVFKLKVYKLIFLINVTFVFDAFLSRLKVFARACSKFLINILTSLFYYI